MTLSTLLLSSIYFAIPCWVFNMGSALLMPLGRTFPRVYKINKPIDFGFTIKGKPLIGTSRTIFSLFIAFIVGYCAFVYMDDSYAFIKILFAFLGTICASFIKRRLDLKEGAPLLFVDQVDYLLFVAIVFYVFSLETISVLLCALVMTMILHPVVCYVAYRLNLKKNPF